jgi:hypothetical protein
MAEKPSGPTVAWSHIVATPGAYAACLLGWVCGIDWRDGSEWLYGHRGLMPLHPHARPRLFKDEAAARRFARRQATTYPLFIRRYYRVPLGGRMPHTGKTYLTDVTPREEA